MEWGTECVCGRIPITLTESVAGGGGEASDPLQSLTGFPVMHVHLFADWV